ncbi:tRNA lysidine(34) synthetase TilS [uncultured Roseibium sp.]|uniref:tRNA lysidine(34) synthetase TilS n=1 Tax=uncultured Roseibium sp. TaxID=1936171 RepID=UPI003216C946
MANVPDQPGDVPVLTQDEVNQLFDPLTGTDAVALGVSGGPDSLALLYLFNDWRIQTGWTGRVLVLTVDHRLRDESALEAQAVSRHCEQLNLDHRILVWEGEKPVSNLQAAARDARYRLMAQEMRAASIDCLLLAHHRDDQVETFLDRLTRGSGVYGLGAMAPGQSNGPHGLRLLRPLLRLPKARLVGELTARRISWAEDPSNRDPDYKRVRLRTMAGLLAEEGLDPDRLVETARRLRRAADAIDTWVADIWRASVTEHPAGPLRLEFAVLAGLPQEVRLRLLARMIRRVTGRDTPPRLSKLEFLEERVLAGNGQQTLSGAIVLRKGGDLFVWKEAGRELPERILLAVGSKGNWDDRYCYRREEAVSDDATGTLTLGALAQEPGTSALIDWPAGWPKTAFACAPALRVGDRLLFVPGLLEEVEKGFLPDVTLCRLPDRTAVMPAHGKDGQGPEDCFY